MSYLASILSLRDQFSPKVRRQPGRPRKERTDAEKEREYWMYPEVHFMSYAGPLKADMQTAADWKLK